MYLPSATLTRTARFLPSDITVSKTPGLTGVTGILSSVVEPVPTLTVMEVAPRGSSAGTWIKAYSCPGPRLQTAYKGANCIKLPALNWTVTFDTCSSKGPTTWLLETHP